MSTSVAVEIHALGLDEASEQLAQFLHVRYVQLERGPACFAGAVVQVGAAVAGRYHGSRNKLERFDVPCGRMFALMPTRGLARVGTTSLGPGQVVVARGPAELAVFTDRECHSMFCLLPDSLAAASRTCTLQLSETQALAFAETIERALSGTNAAAVQLTFLPHMCDSWLQREYLPTRSNSLVAARRHAAVRARVFIDGNLDRRLSLASVCHASYSSPRALEYGFREVFGVSPIAYVRCSRLARVRRELYTSPRAHGIVTQLAMKWGFWHLSQFSKDYHELFGELPSATLSRANRPRMHGLRKSDSGVGSLASS